MTQAPTYVLADILAAMKGASHATDGVARGVSIDTRTLEAENLYVALRGERLDGHAYVKDALAKGASFALVDHLIADVASDRQIVVEDTLQALQDFARYARDKAAYTIIAVTGSVGKTSTKDMLACALGSHAQTYATKGNYNNHIGLPLTLLNTPANTHFLVLEMGMNHAGEIALLSSIARPDVAIITTVEAVHLEFFDSVADIAKAKAEIVEGMRNGAAVILPYDNPHYELLEAIAVAHGQRVISFGKNPNALYCLRNVEVDRAGTQAELMAGDTLMQIHLQASGAHHALNSLSVLACCDVLNINLASAANALAHYLEVKGRGNLQTLGWGGGHIILIDETYNASPASMNAAFERARAIAGSARVVAVLGDMLELGVQSPALHAGLAEPLMQAAIAPVFTVGNHMLHLSHALKGASQARHFQTNQLLAVALIDELRANDYVLFKGSRGSHMEEIIAALSEYSQSSRKRNA